MADDTKGNMQPVRAVLRAVDILRSFTPENSIMTVSELHKRVKLSRPTLYRLLYTLQQSGLIKVSDAKHSYELDYGVAQIAHTWFDSIDVARKAEPILDRLWEELNETIALMIPRGSYRVCVSEKCGRQALSYSRGIGDVDHLTATASGRAILAHLPDDIVATVVSERKQETVALHTELDKVRREGFAYSGGSLEGIVGVAAPVFGPTKFAIASISATGPAVRFSGSRLEACTALVREAAANASAALGYRG